MTELPGPKGTRFEVIRLVTETGSTNADLLAEAAAAGTAEGAVLVTDHQTAGRGRQQRAWHDDPGNALLVSLLLRPRRDAVGLLPLLTGLAAVEAVGRLSGSASTAGLKWPNDVLVPSLGERKLAGILAESATTGELDDDRMIVVIGMGLNLRWGRPPPDEVAHRAATLEEILGRPVDRSEILTAYLQAFDGRLDGLERDGPAAVLAEYRQRCLTLGRSVRFATGTGEHEGTAVDVTPAGLLVLEEIGGDRLELAAGDAHHLGPVEQA